MSEAESLQPEESVAAVDLGSNSFHMIVARPEGSGVVVLDRMRERVVLADGLGPDNMLSGEAQERALACLRRFGQRLWSLRTDRVRAVATHTLRVAANAKVFLKLAESALGHPIEVIPGQEEARLTHLGVVRGLPTIQGKRLLIDIGGGSTECILGDGLETVRADSIMMGSVVWTRRFFPDGRITVRAMRRAIVAAASELQQVERHYHGFGWERSLGSSGTLVSLSSLLVSQKWSDEGITEQGIKSLRRYLLKVGEISRISLPGLSQDRASIVAGGVAIIQALFDRLKIKRIHPSKSALREGVLHDLIGRIHHEDERERTVSTMMRRYGTDEAQARRVGDTACQLLSQCGKSWGIDNPEAAQLLRWGAALHEIGLTVNFEGYQRHSAYLIENSTMAGFSRANQDLLALMVDNHRKKFRIDPLANLPGPLQPDAVRLSLLLRIAVCLNRGRRDNPKGFPVKITAQHEQVELKFPRGWLDKHPLTSLDLEQEREQLAKAGIDLQISPPAKNGK